MSRKIFLFLLIPAVLSLAGCGYQLKSQLDYSTPVAGKKISVPIFANKSYRANLGAFLTGSLVEEFARRSGGNVVSEDAADLILSGAVMTYANNPVSYTSDDKVREYRATITAEATLMEKNTRKVVWKGAVSWSQVYPVNKVNALQQNSESAAIRELCDKLAQQIYERVATGF
jgi:outer membrane lipopolysaccharide assembly protein LptE/RlpB